MGGHGWIVRCVVMIAVTVGAASGCSGAQGASGQSDVGTPAPSVSSSPSATPSTMATATLDDAARARIPKAARAHTPQGAEAFARFYLEQVNQAWMVPDPELIRPYALESCKTCANYVETAQWLIDNHRHYANNPSTIGVSTVLPESTPNRVLVQVVNNQEKSEIVNADGTVHRTMPHVYAGSEVEVRWMTDSWAVRGIKAVL
jgi:hypothetical protein